MTFFRLLTAAALLSATTPAVAGTGPFTVATQSRPAGVILLVDSADACPVQDAALEAAAAAQAGRAVGVIANDSACAAARALMDMDATPAVAFASDAMALGPRGEPNAYLARNRAQGVYVWTLESYRRLDLPASRQVLGVFEGETQAAMIEAALARLSRHPEGYFLLVQTAALDVAAIDALAVARRQGAAVIAPDLVRPASSTAR